MLSKLLFVLKLPPPPQAAQQISPQKVRESAPIYPDVRPSAPPAGFKDNLAQEFSDLNISSGAQIIFAFFLLDWNKSETKRKLNFHFIFCFTDDKNGLNTNKNRPYKENLKYKDNNYEESKSAANTTIIVQPNNPVVAPASGYNYAENNQSKGGKFSGTDLALGALNNLINSSAFGCFLFFYL